MTSSVEVLRRHLQGVADQEEAVRYAETLLADFDHDRTDEDGVSDDLFDGSYTYDADTGSAERYMIAGGGPTVYVVFVFFREMTGYIEYTGSLGSRIVPLPDHIVGDLRGRLRQDRERQ